jgi:hypothetical protein
MHKNFFLNYKYFILDINIFIKFRLLKIFMQLLLKVLLEEMKIFKIIIY